MRDPTLPDPLDRYEAIRRRVFGGKLECQGCNAEAQGLSEFGDPFCWDCLRERDENARAAAAEIRRRAYRDE